ncbi:hypothetical protein CSIM01_12875 [Colletotrichum simmondsii]|uniref:Uncharacterized protein n=1 Tax=Colletotrichum simmondsii TaxID=703756 RepID=A0A135RPH8_9PEZI|nr:hypothetical protein CSIM01_12875 [Colletotrichum simmondsii]
MDTDVGDGNRVEVMKEELKGGPVTVVTPDVAETSIGIVGDGSSDRVESVVMDEAKVASVAEFSATVAAFVVDAEAVDDNVVLVPKSEDGACVTEEAGFETGSELLVNEVGSDTEMEVEAVFSNESVRVVA